MNLEEISNDPIFYAWVCKQYTGTRYEGGFHDYIIEAKSEFIYVHAFISQEQMNNFRKRNGGMAQSRYKVNENDLKEFISWKRLRKIGNIING